MKLPQSLKDFFWDVDFEALDTDTHKFLIIKRILDRGHTADIKWLRTQYDSGEIARVLYTSRDISRPTAKLWADLLGLDHRKVVCLQQPYTPIHFGQSS